MMLRASLSWVWPRVSRICSLTGVLPWFVGCPAVPPAWTDAVTSAFFLLINHLINHACFQNFPAELIYPPPSFETPVTFSFSHPRRACHESSRHRPHSGRHPSRATPAPRSATTPGIPRTPRSRRPVRLAITVVPKITPTPEKPENPQKPFS
jgi:hypothetical protein